MSYFKLLYICLCMKQNVFCTLQRACNYFACLQTLEAIVSGKATNKESPCSVGNIQIGTRIQEYFFSIKSGASNIFCSSANTFK